ncbi:transposable element Tcb2 transposase [Trichonephila clavipes]|nr:transposable element Tcb2 transposase [Trichonephila clavipes]
MGAEFVFMDDNARPHPANIVNQRLQSANITRIDWPVFSPDFNLVEHMWDILDRGIAAHNHLLHVYWNFREHFLGLYLRHQNSSAVTIQFKKFGVASAVSTKSCEASPVPASDCLSRDVDQDDYKLFSSLNSGQYGGYDPPVVTERIRVRSPNKVWLYFLREKKSDLHL